MFLWYSWHNISEALGNNTFTYYNSKAWASVTIPDGSYNIEDLNNVVKTLIDINEKTVNEEDESKRASSNLTIKANYNTLKAEIISKGGYRVNFGLDGAKIRDLLGFGKEKVGKQGITEGDKPVNITNVSTVYIHCSLVDTAYVNDKPSGVIYSFSPSVPPGYQIQERPFNINWLPLPRINSIPKIQMRITNQDEEEVNLNHETVTYTLRIREV